MICKNCGFSNPDERQECIKCGTLFSMEERQSAKPVQIEMVRSGINDNNNYQQQMYYQGGAMTKKIDIQAIIAYVLLIITSIVTIIGVFLPASEFASKRGEYKGYFIDTFVEMCKWLADDNNIFDNWGNIVILCVTVVLLLIPVTLIIKAVIAIVRASVSLIGMKLKKNYPLKSMIGTLVLELMYLLTADWYFIATQGEFEWTYFYKAELCVGWYLPVIFLSIAVIIVGTMFSVIKFTETKNNSLRVKIIMNTSIGAVGMIISLIVSSLVFQALIVCGYEEIGLRDGFSGTMRVIESLVEHEGYMSSDVASVYVSMCIAFVLLIILFFINIGNMRNFTSGLKRNYCNPALMITTGVLNIIISIGCYIAYAVGIDDFDMVTVTSAFPLYITMGSILIILGIVYLGVYYGYIKKKNSMNMYRGENAYFGGNINQN